MPKPSAAVISPAIQAKAERMIAKLRHYHRLGSQSNQPKNPALTSAKLADNMRLNVSTMRKARAFARLYSTKELDQLCALRRPSGLPLQLGHVLYLLTVEDKKARTALQRQAATEGWTSPELYAEIRRHHRGGPRRQGGRPVRVPGNVAGCLRKIVVDGGPWLRRTEEVLGSVKAVSSKDERALAGETAETLHKIAEQAAGFAKSLEKLARRSRR